MPREELVEPPHGEPDLPQGLEVGDRGVALRVDVDDVRQIGDLSVRDEPARREDDALGRHVGRDRLTLALVREALRPALEQVEVLPVGGELQIDRTTELLLQEPEERPHLWYEGGRADEPFEGDDEVARLAPVVDHHGSVERPVLEDGNHLLDPGKLVAGFAEEGLELDRLELHRLEVDDVDFPRGVPDDGLRPDVRAQTRLARREQHRVVVADPVDGARAEARNQPDEAVVPPDAG